jgi:purine catabolism regulator
MGKVAKAGTEASPDLPGLTPGLTVAEVLELSSLSGSKVLAGEAGLGRVVQKLNVMEVPDILPWVKPHELMLTTGYPLRNTPQELAELITDLDARRLAAIAIKLGRYIDELPDGMLASAQQLGFPVIRLPDTVSFDDVLNQVLTEILNRQAALLERSERVHRALVQIVLEGGALQEVTDELTRLLNGPVCITDPGGRVLAASGEVPARDSALLRGAAGLRSHADSFAAVAPIVAGSFDHGRLIALPGDRELGPADVHILERAATVAALVITKQLAVSAVESKYHGDFLRDVLAGRAGEVDRILHHAASLGWDLERPLAVVVAELDGDGASRGVHDRLVGAWAAAVRARDPRTAVVGYAREVVTLLPVPPDALDRTVRQLATTVAADVAAVKRTFSTGASRVTDGPAGLPDAYEQARQALQVGRQLQGRSAIATFDELGVYRLLALVPDGAELRSFVRETLGPLGERVDSEAQDLRQTLKVLLDTNLNVAETARQLHFHYNTLRYRIGKLERMLGRFTEDPHLRLNLALALQVIQMRGI